MYRIIFGSVRVAPGQWQPIPDLLVNTDTSGPPMGPFEIARVIALHVHEHLGALYHVVVDTAQLCGWIDFGRLASFRLIPQGPTFGEYPLTEQRKPGPSPSRPFLVPVPDDDDPGGGEPA